MRAADAAALATVTEEVLVGRAGTAVGHAALRILGGGYGRRVIVIAGKGSNGADGRVAAAFLARRGGTWWCSPPPTPLPRCPVATW